MESRDMTESGLGAIPTGTLLGNKSPRTLDRMWAQDLLCSCSMHEVRIDKRESGLGAVPTERTLDSGSPKNYDRTWAHDLHDITEIGLGAIPTRTLLDSRRQGSLDRLWAHDLQRSWWMDGVQQEPKELG